MLILTKHKSIVTVIILLTFTLHITIIIINYIITFFAVIGCIPVGNKDNYHKQK